MRSTRSMLALAAGLAFGSAAWAALPPPSPAEAQKAAAKKAEADAKAAQEKEALNASMDRISGHWRQRAAKEGWKAKPPVALAAAPASGAAPLSQPALDAAKVPVKSEKLGTARPSEDVKAGPTRSEPAGASPTVNRPGVPANAHKE